MHKLARACAGILLAALSAAAARADDGRVTTREEQRQMQDSIYKSRGADRPEGYIVDRSLPSYVLALGEGFKQLLGRLGPQDQWLDIGAGEANAVLDYRADRYDGFMAESSAGTPGKARVVAMSIEDRRTARWHETEQKVGSDQLRYIHGKPLREYGPADLGKFRLITDVMGGFSYTEVLSTFMERTLALLEVGGSFFTVALDVHSETGNNAPHYKGSPYRTYIENAEGKEVKLCSWLKSIGCVQVNCEFKDSWEPPVELYRVHKTCEQVTVPALRSVEYTAGTPPQRGYRLIDAATTAGGAATPTASATPAATVVVQPRAIGNATATPVIDKR